MSEINIFEEAARKKLRFSFKGVVSAEDLYDLSEAELNNMFIVLHRQVTGRAEESLLKQRSTADRVLDLQIKIVRHIFETKVSERTARENATMLRAKRNKLLGIKAAQEDASLGNLTAEQLAAEINALTEQLGE